MKKKLLLILLTVFMAFALAACGSEKDDKGGKASINGIWTLEYDGSEQVSAELGGDATFVFNIIMEFNSDNTMRMYADVDSLKNAMSNLTPFMVQIMYEQLEAELGYDKETADKFVQEKSGMTIQEFCETQLIDLMDFDDLTEEFNVTGTYKVKGDKLYLADDDGVFDDYVIFSVDGDTLTLNDPSGADEIEGLKLPLKLKRQ